MTHILFLKWFKLCWNQYTPWSILMYWKLKWSIFFTLLENMRFGIFLPWVHFYWIMSLQLHLPCFHCSFNFVVNTAQEITFLNPADTSPSITIMVVGKHIFSQNVFSHIFVYKILYWVVMKGLKKFTFESGAENLIISIILSSKKMPPHILRWQLIFFFFRILLSTP